MKEQRQNRQNGVLAAVIITMAACLLFALNSGIRFNYGILRGAIERSSGVSYTRISFILAVAQVVYGVAQPLFGIVAMKRGNAFVILCGAVSIIVALTVIPFCRSFLSLLIFLGILLPTGPGALAFGIIMGAVTPMLGEKRAAFVSGLVNASSGLGTFVFSPVLQRLLATGGLRSACLLLSCVAVFAILVSVALRKQERSGELRAEEEKESVLDVFREAFRDRNYRLILVGFTTCGYQMAIIETHYYTQITGLGFSDSLAASAFSLYGVATVLAGVVCGALLNRFPTGMKNILGTIYGLRPVCILLFLFLPKSAVSVYLFAFALGFTGGPTVPPTSGLINKFFGSKRLATLLGIAFVFHQIGSFFSAWIGGILVSATGNYTALWLSSAVLASVAATASYLIREK